MLKFFVAIQSYAASKSDELSTREEGQTMAEYGVVLAVITVAALLAFKTLGGNISTAINSVADMLK